MKNLKYFPYERNRYFYGKLLGVEDFEAEQKYLNDKRRLINRFMHGCGVVCGLNIVQVEDDTVSVEAGLALDFCGREILVDEPVTRRLSELDGFSDYEKDADSGSYLYLCIEYEEYEKHPVYSVAGSGADGNAQCSRIAEGYHLYLTGQEPEKGMSGSLAYYERKKTLYWGNGVRISQVFPRCVRSGSEFEARIVVENMGQKQSVSFSYELVLDCLKKDGKQRLRVEFDEKDHEKAKRYEIPVVLEAGNGSGITAWVKLKEGSFVFRADGHVLEAQAAAEHSVEITDEPVEDVIGRRYLTEAMREIKNENDHQGIYLAKISLFGVGNTVLIDDVEEMPFGQYICSDILSGIRETAAVQQQKALVRKIGTGGGAAREKGEPVEPVQGAFTGVSGMVGIDLGIGGVRGQKFFSEPVAHGLGPGSVSVLCGIAGNAKKPSAVYYGESEVFGEDDCEVSAKTAVKVDTVNGTFVAGIMLTEATTAGSVKLHWTAFRDCTDEQYEAERSLFIKPDMVYLSLREDYTFEAAFGGTDDRRVLWSVTEKEGGSIDGNGMYTAPAVPGIYEIVARSAAYPKLFATAYAVVRDIGPEQGGSIC